MKIKTIETNECEIQINARNAGDFGFVRIGGQSRSPREEYRLCEEIVGNIKRHVDDIGWTNIHQKQMYETEDGEQFETMFEALEHLYDTEGCGSYFEYRYKHPNEKYGTRSRANNFEKLIVDAYANPYNFELVRGELTPEQTMFLWKVVDTSLDDKLPKAINSTESPSVAAAETGIGGSYE
ncbi:hypothetical protein R50345_05940 [Paenibacillus sp. FSL R5-0345]|uniref:hypothetical protein n=1 Tax=Paenibacillus sp. FSL R5-0345 TaxID=1536770 RepID=UPI0004F6BA4A|nr:hypothetical protein [Paenibacillus sp. FSL R5-0345]AIQ34206.1 hypothetical protein R50345_05940 [Paenibacillus sp. FSL R5-0345]